MDARLWLAAVRLIGRAENTDHRPGWIPFAIRPARGCDLIAVLAEHWPPGADDMYGSSHRQAACWLADWNSFVTGLRFGPDAAPLRHGFPVKVMGRAEAAQETDHDPADDHDVDEGG